MSSHVADRCLHSSPRSERLFGRRADALRRLAFAAPLLALGLAGRASAADLLPGEQALVLQYASVPAPPFGGGAALVSGDMDGDGDVDVVCADAQLNLVRVLINQRGSFTPFAVNVGGAPSALALADLDVDGDLDVIVGLSSQIRVLRHDGNALVALAPIALHAGDSGPVSLDVRDVDADGQLDLLIGLAHHSLPNGSATGGLVVAKGDGLAFQLGPTHELASPAHRVVIADFNGDGLPDAAELGGWISATSVNLALASAGGGFVNGAVSYASGLYASGFAAGDWDGDGDMDLATGNKYDVRLLLNDGSGQFTLGQVLGVGSYVKGLAAGDLDRDGDTDLLATSGSSAAIRLLTNDGHGTFATTASLPATSQATSVMLADTSGDGYLDPWAGDVVSGTLSLGASKVLVARYGAGKAGVLGCVPAMGVSGKPSLSVPGFVVQATGEPGGQPALMLVGFAPAALPALGGEILVQLPWISIALTTSPGSGDPALCDGTISLPIGTAALSAAGLGTRIHVQVLAKDSVLPGSDHVTLSDGLWFEIAP